MIQGKYEEFRIWYLGEEREGRRENEGVFGREEKKEETGQSAELSKERCLDCLFVCIIIMRCA